MRLLVINNLILGRTGHTPEPNNPYYPYSIFTVNHNCGCIAYWLRPRLIFLNGTEILVQLATNIFASASLHCIHKSLKETKDSHEHSSMVARLIQCNTQYTSPKKKKKSKVIFSGMLVILLCPLFCNSW